ncbi:hypothetical protein ACIOD2_47350 [Amycolatopsis sp. NPDC088138]|uniref:hypothetical protein n=1 Tax=Amycolatopsis sp. NPDC088138 TaxID=3363938 RepID=UPI0037FB8747
MGADRRLALRRGGDHDGDGVVQTGAHGVVAGAARRVVMDHDRVERPLPFAVFARVVAFVDAGERGDDSEVVLEGDVQPCPGVPLTPTFWTSAVFFPPSARQLRARREREQNAAGPPAS